MMMRYTMMATFLLSIGLGGCVITKPSTQPGSQQLGLELIDQGTVWLRAGELDRASGAYETAWQLAKLPAALDGMGCVAFRRGDARQAEALFIQAYQADHSYSAALANLALLYKQHGLSDAAKRLYIEAVQRNPKNYRARNNFGVLLSDIDTSAHAAKAELLRAAALKRDPLIESNLRSISEE